MQCTQKFFKLWCMLLYIFCWNHWKHNTNTCIRYAASSYSAIIGKVKMVSCNFLHVHSSWHTIFNASFWLLKLTSPSSVLIASNELVFSPFLTHISVWLFRLTSSSYVLITSSELSIEISESFFAALMSGSLGLSSDCTGSISNTFGKTKNSEILGGDKFTKSVCLRGNSCFVLALIIVSNILLGVLESSNGNSVSESSEKSNSLTLISDDTFRLT